MQLSFPGPSLSWALKRSLHVSLSDYFLPSFLPSHPLIINVPEAWGEGRGGGETTTSTIKNKKQNATNHFSIFSYRRALRDKTHACVRCVCVLQSVSQSVSSVKSVSHTRSTFHSIHALENKKVKKRRIPPPPTSSSNNKQNEKQVYSKQIHKKNANELPRPATHPTLPTIHDGRSY